MSSKSGLGGRGVGFGLHSLIPVCSRIAFIGVGWGMCIVSLSPLVIVQFRYVSGKPSRFILYLLGSIVLNRSMDTVSEVATMKSSNITAVIVYDPSSSNLKKTWVMVRSCVSVIEEVFG